MRPSTRKAHDPVFLLMLGTVLLALACTFALRTLIAARSPATFATSSDLAAQKP